MSKLCRQVSIETPGSTLRECVSSFDIPVPEVPIYGTRIRVAYAGACYQANRTRSASVCSTSSISSVGSLAGEVENLNINSTPAHVGLRDGALFPGYEVAGIVDAFGKAADRPSDVHEGSRIVVYPYLGVPQGYAEYIVVPDTKCLVPIPDNLPLSVAATLPSGALLAMNMVYAAGGVVDMYHKSNKKSTILIVGTGGLALWALRIAAHCFKDMSKEQVAINVAVFKDDGFSLAKECEELSVTVVQWSEDLHEKQLIERTIDACGGPVDIVLNFGSTSRSVHRSMQCLAPEGMVLVTEEVGERLIPKFSKKADDMNVQFLAVPNGTIEQLRELVYLVASGQIHVPPHTVFPAEEVQEVVKKLCNSEIHGRAILKFHNID